MSFKVNLGKDGHKQMRLLFQCEIGPEVPQQGSLTFCLSQHAFKIGKPRISSLHITSLTLFSKMYFIGSQVYMMAVCNVHYKYVRRSVRRSYLNRGAPKTERANGWMEQVWGNHRWLQNSLPYTAPGPWHCSTRKHFL